MDAGFFVIAALLLACAYFAIGGRTSYYRSSQINWTGVFILGWYALITAAAVKVVFFL